MSGADVIGMMTASWKNEGGGVDSLPSSLLTLLYLFFHPEKSAADQHV